MKKVKVLMPSFLRYEKNEEGDKVKRRYNQGDVVEVSDAHSERLLGFEVGGRPLFEKVDDSQRETKSENKPRTANGE